MTSCFNVNALRHRTIRAVIAISLVTAMLTLSLGQAFPAVADESEPGTSSAVAATSDVSIASLTTTYQIQGNVGYSADGLGQNTTGGLIQADVPAGSTVVKAFLYGSYFFTVNPNLAQRTIDFDGTLVETTLIATVGGFLSTTRADVTAQVAAKVGGGGGITNFAINNDPSNLNGVGLVVVYTNPSLPLGTVAILDGGASQAGDTFFFNLAAPLDKTLPGFSAIMSLGSGHSYQGGSGPGTPVCGGGQFSIIDVNSMRLSTCAGNYDDGFGNNGALITVGGVGDDILNPPNPFGSGGNDDELYNIEPFLSQGDTVIQIDSSNPSQDDALFLSVISITALAIVSPENCGDGIDNDGDGLIDGADPDCVFLNQPPVADANGPYSGDEGSAISIDGTASSDLDGDPLTYAWSYTAGADVDAGAACAFGDASAALTTITCTDDGTYDLTLTVNDGTTSDSDSTTVTVGNVAPDLTITSPSAGNEFVVTTAVDLSGAFSDQGTNDTHTCSIDWDDGAGPQAGTVSEAGGSGTCTGSQPFASAGVYSIQVTVTDDDGGSDTKSVMIIVYDPNAGFVTGGGWIDSPSGAYTPDDPTDPDITGRVNFGFVSKYQKGATTPTGQTEFQFQAGDLNFHSSGYQWLVVAGDEAQYKGTGTINGEGAYGLLLTVTDGQINGSGVDEFRIKIWDTTSNIVIYDNVPGASEDIDAANPQPIANGSIVIHKAK